MTSPLQQKIRIKGPVIVTANRLADGAVVYRTPDANWSQHLDDAAVVSTEADATRLLKEAAAEDTGAVGAYISPVHLRDGHIEPGNLRERIRLKGLTFELPASFGI
jgi:predicted NAD/FAD-binding protein